MMLSKSPKYFCVSCRSIQQYEDDHCIKCRKPVIEIYYNDRYPKHPKKSDNEFIASSIVIRLNRDTSHYNALNADWDDEFRDTLRTFIDKFYTNRKYYGAVDTDKLLTELFSTKKEEEPYSHIQINHRELPEHVEDFINRFNIKPSKNYCYVVEASAWFTMATSLMNRNMRSDDVGRDFFKVRKTRLLTKGNASWLKNVMKVWSWDGSEVSIPYATFNTKEEALAFSGDLVKVVLSRPEDFPDTLVEQAQKYRKKQCIEFSYPEMMI